MQAILGSQSPDIPQGVDTASLVPLPTTTAHRLSQRLAQVRKDGTLAPIYAKTASYGHFGREVADFTWEATDRVDALRETADA